jgi:hypothetical protein
VGTRDLFIGPAECLRYVPPAAAVEAGRRAAAALTGQLTQLGRRRREQVAELQRALQAAHGENLLLRRRLGRQPQEPDSAEASS